MCRRKNNQNPNDFAQLKELILYKKFRIPGESEKCLKYLTDQDTYKIFILNNKTQLTSKGYWENKFDGIVVDWNLWFDCNLLESKVVNTPILFSTGTEKGGGGGAKFYISPQIMKNEGLNSTFSPKIVKMWV